MEEIRQYHACLVWLEFRRVLFRSHFCVGPVAHDMFSSVTGVPSLWDLMPDDLRWSWCNNNRNKVHNKCNTFESSPNHPLPPVEKLFSVETVLGAKNVGDCAVKDYFSNSRLSKPCTFQRHFTSKVALKNQTANAGELRDPGYIRVLGRSSGGGHGDPLPYSCLENLMDGGAWQTTVHGVAKSLIQLGYFTFTFK